MRAAAAPKPLAPEEHNALELRLLADAPRFDLRPLLEQLALAGYGNEAVLFECATESGGAGLVKGLRFLKTPMRTAIITVHLGLMGEAGLLPSYFTWVAERSPETAGFVDFMRFFEHQLIDNMFHATHPEWDPPRPCADSRLARDTRSVLGDTPTFLRSILRMANPTTPSTLHWIAQLCYPEFGLCLRRQAVTTVTQAYACRVGVSRLDGTGILGRDYQASLQGFVLDLFADDEVDLSGREQADVVLARLRGRLLPLLAPYHLPLTVRLTIRWHSSFAQVDDPADPDPSFLGYNRLGGPRDVSYTTALYTGITGHDWGPRSEAA